MDKVYESEFMQSIWDRVSPLVSNQDEILPRKLFHSITDLITEALKENPQCKLAPEAAIKKMGGEFKILEEYVDRNNILLFSSEIKEGGWSLNYNRTIIFVGDFIRDPSIEIVYDYYESGTKDGLRIPIEKILELKMEPSHFFEYGKLDIQQIYLLLHRKGTQRAVAYQLSYQRGSRDSYYHRGGIYTAGWGFFDKIHSLCYEIGERLLH